MPDLITSADVDAFMASAHKTAMRTALDLGDAATKNTGTTSGSLAAGDHSHSALSVQAAGTASVRALGTGSTQACAGNDVRLSDARPPTAHTHDLMDIDGLDPALNSLYIGQSDLTLALADKADAAHSHDVASTSAAGFLSAADQTKLNGIATGANNYSLPVPTTTVIGGVKRNTGSAGQYVSGVDTDGALLYGTPSGGGGALANVTETLLTASPNNTINALQLEVSGGSTKTDLVLTPKSTAAVIAGNEPDGSATGGNKRGDYAFDAQMVRASAGQVASGYAAFAAGSSNTASGTYGVALGVNNVASSTGCVALGNNCTADWTANVAAGYLCTATQPYSVALGQLARADRHAALAFASGQFATQGDSQYLLRVARIKTTNATATEMLVDTTARLTVPAGKTQGFLVIITGVRSDGADACMYVRQGFIKNVSGTTALVGSIATVGTDIESNASTNASLTADDTNDALKIEVTGIASETWRWTAVVMANEMTIGS